MNKLKRIFTVGLCTLAVSAFFVGCNEVDKGTYVTTSDESSSQSSGDELVLVPSTGAWTSMKFSLDGTEISFDKIPLADIKALGYNFEPETYGLSDISAEKGVYYQRSVVLEHEGYDSETVVAGFTNFGDTPCSIDEVQVWAMEFVKYGKSACPEVVLEGGITWDSTKDDIVAAYGEPSVVKDESGAQIVSYSTEAQTDVLHLYLYDGKLGRIIIESY